MYSILGIASKSSATEPFERARPWVGITERKEMTALEPASDHVRWGTTGEGGAVLGTARDADRGLAYLGSFHHPFPGWEKGSPLDEPERTARVLLDRFSQDGLGFLNGLCGHFVVVVVEPNTQRLLLARAPGGSQRVFVKDLEDGLAFSTKLVDLRGLLGEKLRLDRSLEDFLLGYEFLPHERTPYQGVRVLQPGTILEWQEGGHQVHPIAKPKPWGDRFADADLTDEARVIETLHDAFQTAVEEVVPATERVAVLLGGFDSALIAATLHALGKQVETFSFQYDDPSYNQAHTDDLARLLGIRHHWVPITPDVMREGLQNFSERFNQVVGQPHYVIATAHTCRVIREGGILHCLTGDGCDGLFMGYPTVHMRAKLIQGLSRVAPVLRKPLHLLTGSAFLERRLGHPYRIVRNVATILRRPMPARGHIAACTLDSHSLRLLRGSAPPQERETEELLRELAEGLEDVSSVRLAYLGKGRVGLNLTKLEGAAAFSGVTVNSPFLHPGMVQVAGRIPDELSRPGRDTKAKATGKYAFTRMAEQAGLLPPELIYQEKMSPVTSPVDYWYWGEMREFMLQQLEKLPFAVDDGYAQSLVIPKLAERLFREHVGIGRYVTPAIALLATYASFTQFAAAD